jgi:hypothetical protein
LITPVALEIAGHELRIEIIQDTMRGASPYAKRTYRQRIAAHERRIAELRALLVIAAAAALPFAPIHETLSCLNRAAPPMPDEIGQREIPARSCLGLDT